jgi:hypothetical protein
MVCTARGAVDPGRPKGVSRLSHELEDLQAVSQHVLGTAQAIRELEEDKRGVQPGTPRFQELSDDIERLAEQIRSVVMPRPAWLRSSPAR